MNSLGVPEIFVAVFVFAVWLIPLAAGLYVLVIVTRVWRTQALVLQRLESIEKRLGSR